MQLKLRFFLLASSLWLVHVSHGQAWNEYRQVMESSTRNSMVVLGGWAAGNIATSAFLLGRHEGSQRHFHQMNIGWNLINLGLATSGWIGARRGRKLEGQQILRRHERMRQLLLFNAGLDLGYMAAGAWMIERSISSPEMGPILHGFGRSIVLQGAFLFLFDMGTFLYLDKQHRQFDLRCTPSMNGIGLALNF